MTLYIKKITKNTQYFFFQRSISTLYLGSSMMHNISRKLCFVTLLKELRMWVCILATQLATLASLFWHSIYCPVIWGLSFSLHPKFLCPCAAKISLCVRVNHLSYAHAPLRKGQGCHLIPAALLSYLCASYSRPLAVSQLGYPSTRFYPHRTNSMDIKRSYMSAKCCHK